MSDRQSTHETLPSEWQVINLSAMIAPESPITYGVVQPGQEVVDGIPFVRGGDIYGGKIAVHKLRTISSSISSAYRRTLLRGGELLMSLVGYPGEVAVVPNELAGANIARQAALMRLDRTHDAKYVMYFLLSDLGKQRIFEQSNGSAQQVVNLADLKRVRVTLPPLPQQRKIVRILATVDNLIEKTEALIAKYQAIKQGMMHDLFTRGVDEHGHLRPPYEEAPELYKQSDLGWIPKEWEVERYGDACDKVSVGIATSTTVHFRERGVPLLRNQNILTTGIQTDDLLYISPEFDVFNKTKRIRPNDILTMRTGYPGKSALVPPEMDGWQTFTTLISHPIEEKYRPEFAVRQINSDACMTQIQSLQGGGAQQNLNVGWFVNLRVLRPPLSEQDAIVERLAVVEGMVRQCEWTNGKNEQTKTGLMQDLLTGKVRVKVDEGEEVAHA